MPIDLSGLDVSGLNSLFPQKPKRNPIAAGLSAGVDNLQELGYNAAAAVSDVVGAERARDWLLERAALNQREAYDNGRPDLEQVEDQTLGSAIPFAAYQISKQLPQIAGALGLGAVAPQAVIPAGLSRAAASLPGVVGGGGLRAGADFAARRAALQAGQKFAGNLVGGAGVGSVMGAGSMYGESVDAGDPNAVGALLAAPVYGLTEGLPTAVLGGTLARGAYKGAVGTRMAKAAGVNALGGSSAELLQNEMEMGFNPTLTPEEVASRRLNSAVIGGLAEGVLGAPAGLRRRPDEPVHLMGSNPTAKPADPTQATVQPLPQPPGLDPNAAMGMQGDLFDGAGYDTTSTGSRGVLNPAPAPETWSDLMRDGAMLAELEAQAIAAGDQPQLFAIREAQQQLAAQLSALAGDQGATPGQRRLFDTGVYDMVGNQPVELTGDQAAAGGLPTLEGQMERAPQLPGRVPEIVAALRQANGGRANANLIRFATKFDSLLDNPAALDQFLQTTKLVSGPVLERAIDLAGAFNSQRINAMAQDGARRAQPGVTMQAPAVGNATEQQMRMNNAQADAQETAQIESMLQDEQDLRAMESMIPERQEKTEQDGQMRLFSNKETGRVMPNPAAEPAPEPVDQSRQGKLFTTRGKPTKAAERTGKGQLEMFPDQPGGQQPTAETPAPEETGKAPKQGELFTAKGNPTKAAQRTGVSGSEQISEPVSGSAPKKTVEQAQREIDESIAKEKAEDAARDETLKRLDELDARLTETTRLLEALDETEGEARAEVVKKLKDAKAKREKASKAADEAIKKQAAPAVADNADLEANEAGRAERAKARINRAYEDGALDIEDVGRLEEMVDAGETTKALEEVNKLAKLNKGPGARRYRTRNGSGTPSNSITDSALREIVADVEKALGGAADITILDSVTDLLPKERPGSRAGALVDGKVYLFRDGIPSGIEGQKTIFHELFHKGLRNLLSKDEYLATLTKLYNQSAEVRRLADAWLKNDQNKKDVADKSEAEQRVVAVDEVLAEMAENTDLLTPSLMRQIGDWLASVADRFGMTKLAQNIRSMGRTPLELFVRSALQASVDGRPTDSGTRMRPGTDAFKKWFGKSVVRDGTTSNPQLMYTGTSKDVDFTTFKVPKNGVWFTSRRDDASQYAVENDSMDLKYDPETRGYAEVNTASRVMPVYLRIENPYTLTDADYERINKENYKKAQGELFDELRAKGYDGVYMGGGTWVVIGDASQIKSAIGNVGSYGQRPVTDAEAASMGMTAKKANAAQARGDIRFRTATEAAADIADSLKVNNLGRARRAVLDSSFLRDIGARYEKEFSRVKEYVDMVFEMASTAGRMLKAAVGVNDGFNKLKPELRKRVMELMADATSNRVVIEPTAERTNAHLTEEEKVIAKELQDRFAALPANAKQVYREARDALAANWNKRGELLSRSANEIYDPLIASAEAAGNEAQTRTLKREKREYIEDINARLNEIKGDYFPMSRFGGYVVVRKSDRFDALQKAADEAYEKLDALLTKYEGEPGTRKAVRETNKILKAAGNEQIGEFTPEQKAEIDAARKAYKEAQAKVEAAKANESDYYVAQFETEAEASRNAKEVGGKAQLKEKYYSELNPINRTVLARMEESLANTLRGSGNVEALRDAKRAMFNVYLNSLPELSALKRQAKRKYVAGFDRDMQRSIASSLVKDSFYLSRMEYMDQISGALNSVKNEAADNIELQEVYDQLAKRHAASMRFVETPIQDQFSAMTYAWMLGVSPGFLIANMTQPFIVTAPMLAARHGVARTTKQFGKAYADVAKMVSESVKGNWKGEIKFDSLADAGEKRMLEKMLAQGLLTVSLTQDITNVAKGLDTGSYWSVAKKVIALPAHHAEVINRISSALAAYRLQIQRGSEAEAIDYAQKALADTHFDYSAENAPYWMKPGVLPMSKILFQFKKYQAGMISLYVKTAAAAFKGESAEVRAEGKKQLFGMLATQVSVAGAVGLPLYFPLKMLAALIAGAFGDDEEPFDADVAFRNYLTDITGSPEVAAVLAKGLPALAGMDLSQKVGAGNLLNPAPTLRDNKEGRDLYLELLASAAGPFLGGILPRFMDGFSFLGKGEVTRAAESFAPKFVADAIRAGRFAAEGVETRKGVTMIGRDELSGWDLMLQAAGVPALEITDRYEARSAIEGEKRFYQDRASEMKRKWLDAKKSGDNDEASELWAEIRDKVNPARRKAGLKPITLGDLMQYQRSVGKQEADYAKYGATVGKNVKLGEAGRFAQ